MYRFSRANPPSVGLLLFFLVHIPEKQEREDNSSAQLEHTVVRPAPYCGISLHWHHRHVLLTCDLFVPVSDYLLFFSTPFRSRLPFLHRFQYTTTPHAFISAI